MKFNHSNGAWEQNDDDAGRLLEVLKYKRVIDGIDDDLIHLLVN